MHDSSEIQRRYRRQAAYVEIGAEGQALISNCTVAICGLGALGAMVAERLCRAGVGALRLIDRDWVEVDNLPRQALYTTDDAVSRTPKAIAARAHLQAIEPNCRIETHVVDLTHRNAFELLTGVDCIVDGTDNFEARFLINDVAFKSGTPWVHAGIVGASGQSMVFAPERTACFRCLMPDPPDPQAMQTCDSAGVLGPAVGVIASWQAIEVIKLLVNAEARADGMMRVFDLWNGNIRNIKVKPNTRDNGCRCCVQRNYDFLDGKHGTETKILCGRNAVQIQPASEVQIDLSKLAERLSGEGAVLQNQFFLRFSTLDTVVTIFTDGRAIIAGTENPDQARKIYARWIGG